MGSCCSIPVSSEHQISSPSPSLSQSNNSDVGKENQYQNQNPQQPPDNQLEGPVLKLKQGFTKNKKPKGDTNYGLCSLNPHANFQKNIQPLQEEPVTEKFREKIDYSSEIYTRKKDDFTRYYSIINENKMNEVPNNQKSIKHQLFLQKQPGKDYLLEPNSFYQGYFDVDKQIKYNYGKIILKQYDSHFNQSFFTYEGPFVKNKCKGKNGKQFYGKSNVIQFEGEWNSQGRLEATGKFYDGANTLIPNPNPKPQPNRKIKIISITDTKTGSSIQQQTLPQSWCAFDQLYYEKDLKILQGTGWLNSSIIDGYINFLNYTDQKTYWEMDNRYNYKRMFIFASSVFSNFHENQKQMNQYNFKKEFLEFEPIEYKLWKIFKKIGMVINQNNSHWYFVILDFKSKLMIIQDSIRGMKQHYKTVKNILEQLFSDQNEQINFEIQIDQKCLQQNNGYDCGTYVCLNAKRLFLSERFENQNQIEIDKNITNPVQMRNELYTFLNKFRNIA